jgi:hypothetical protein
MKVEVITTGPGVICPKAMPSMNSLEVSQPRLSTTSCFKTPTITNPLPYVREPTFRKRRASARRFAENRELINTAEKLLPQRDAKFFAKVAEENIKSEKLLPQRDAKFFAKDAKDNGCSEKLFTQRDTVDFKEKHRDSKEFLKYSTTEDMELSIRAENFLSQREAELFAESANGIENSKEPEKEFNLSTLNFLFIE